MTRRCLQVRRVPSSSEVEQLRRRLEAALVENAALTAKAKEQGREIARLRAGGGGVSSSPAADAPAPAPPSLAPFAAAAADAGWATFGGGSAVSGDPFAACEAAPIPAPLPPTEEQQQQQQQQDWRL